jgi:hypothetical protein
MREAAISPPNGMSHTETVHNLGGLNPLSRIRRFLKGPLIVYQ